MSPVAVLPWWHCDSHTSGFVDDVTLARDGISSSLKLKFLGTDTDFRDAPIV